MDNLSNTNHFATHSRCFTHVISTKEVAIPGGGGGGATEHRDEGLKNGPVHNLSLAV